MKDPFLILCLGLCLVIEFHCSTTLEKNDIVRNEKIRLVDYIPTEKNIVIIIGDTPGGDRKRFIKTFLTNNQDGSIKRQKQRYIQKLDSLLWSNISITYSITKDGVFQIESMK